MHECPKCKAAGPHRSRSRSKWEVWRKEITRKRPFRCAVCGWRGWGVDEGPHFAEAQLRAAERAVAPDPPNLPGTAGGRGAGWTDFDPKVLDADVPLAGKDK